MESDPHQGMKHSKREGWTCGKTVVLTTALLMAVSSGIGVAFAVGEEAKDVRTLGNNYFEPNAFIQSTLRFEPGNQYVESGDTIRLEHRDDTLEPHTLTVVKQGDLPASVDEIFACAVCEEDPCRAGEEDRPGASSRGHTHLCD